MKINEVFGFHNAIYTSWYIYVRMIYSTEYTVHHKSDISLHKEKLKHAPFQAVACAEFYRNSTIRQHAVGSKLLTLISRPE